MESFGVETEEGVKNRNLYLFYEDVCSKHTLHVYAIDSSSLLMYLVTKLPRGDSCEMGCITHGSKLYAIGGVFRDSHAQGYPRDVLVCDLSKRKGREGDQYKWKAGPVLNAGKPYPMVVAVKGKIYALAGHADHDVPVAIDPTFEFLDHRGVWHPLPEPPFYSWYSMPPGPTLLCYTVSGNIIYVLVQKPDHNEVVELLYSFNVLKKKWKEHPRGVLCGDRVGDNLSSHKWLNWADLEDGKLYLAEACGGSCRLYAHDLITSKKKKFADEIVSDASACEIYGGLPVSWDVQSSYLECGCNGVPYVRLPVKLLKILDVSEQSLVAHVGNRMLLVVCAYNPPRKFPDDGRFVYTCLLKLVKVEDNICKASCSEKRRDCAVIVKQQYHKMNRLFDHISSWSTMKGRMVIEVSSDSFSSSNSSASLEEIFREVRAQAFYRIPVDIIEPSDHNEVVELLYSFNVLKKKWKEHPRGVLCGDRVGDNLSSHKWLNWADLEDGKLYLAEACGGSCRLYAHDLITSKKKKFADEIVSDASTCEIYGGLPVSWDVQSSYLECGCNGVPYVRLPVKLLKILDVSEQSLVAHVENRMLLVVCAYNPPRKFPDDGRFVYTCLLKLVKVEDNICKASCSEKRRDCAVIVKQQYHKMNRLFDHISSWSTV